MFGKSVSVGVLYGRFLEDIYSLGLVFARTWFRDDSSSPLSIRPSVRLSPVDVGVLRSCNLVMYRVYKVMQRWTALVRAAQNSFYWEIATEALSGAPSPMS